MRRFQVAVASAFVGAAGVVGVLAAVGLLNESPSRSRQVSFQALSGPIVSLPSRSLTPTLQQLGDRSGVDAHLVLRSHGSRVFAVASRDGRYLCLTVREATGTKADTCGLLSGLGSDDVIWIRTGVPGGLSDLYGLVPDGIEAVHAGALSAVVKNNAFVLNAVPASATTLVVTGSGIDHAVSLGPPEAAPVTITTSLARS
jgi:hypothetical protein